MIWHIVGDVHGCIHQLRMLLLKLGYTPGAGPYQWTPPAGCKLISVGDVVDRGPDSLACLRTLMHMERAGHAELVLGNHEIRYRQMLAYLLGETPTLGRLPESRLIAYLQLLGLPPEEQLEIATWLDARPLHMTLDDGSRVVHAAWSRAARDPEKAVEICAFGRGHNQQHRAARHLPPSGTGLLQFGRETTLPPRVGWVHTWSGPETIFWGHHVVVPGAVTRIGHTVNVESGCYSGNSLSAYVHPTGEVVQTVGTRRHWRTHLRPFLSVQGALFPPSVEAVREVIKRESLETVEDYIAWLELQCEAAKAPPLPQEIVEAHRRLASTAALDR